MKFKDWFLDTPCEWTLEDEDNGTWATKCERFFSLITGTPKVNGFDFCPYCGKPIEEKQPVKEVD
jgi:rRNA maturation endonuclease Nob1